MGAVYVGAERRCILPAQMAAILGQFNCCAIDSSLVEKVFTYEELLWSNKTNTGIIYFPKIILFGKRLLKCSDTLKDWPIVCTYRLQNNSIKKLAVDHSPLGFPCPVGTTDFFEIKSTIIYLYVQRDRFSLESR